MFAVAVSFRVVPGKLKPFLSLVRENARTSLELEPGCHVFDICTDPERPDEVFLYEVYESGGAFQAHLDTAHFKSFDSAVAPMLSDKSVTTYREVLR